MSKKTKFDKIRKQIEKKELEISQLNNAIQLAESELYILNIELSNVFINDYKDENGFISTWDAKPIQSETVEVFLRNGSKKIGLANNFDFSQSHPCENEPLLVSKWKYLK
jgi:hypothetical protein